LGIVLIKRSEITGLSANVRKLIDGQSIDIRDNCEGALSALRNDIHTLVTRRGEEVDALQRERDMLKTPLQTSPTKSKRRLRQSA
jgi:hypothetical protein